MISVQQMKAARGLLEWNQSDLAKASGLHVNAINNVERRQGSPRWDTIAQIQNAFEAKGIRFKGTSGVELVEETLEIRKYAGTQFIRVLTDDILLSLQGPQDELIAVLPDERLFDIDQRENDRYYKAQKRLGFRHRLILSAAHGHTYSQPNEVRYLSDVILGKISYQVYGDKFVLINWEAQELVMIRSASLALSFRRQFDYLWEQAKPHKRRK